jgi:hypothetical protein
MTQYAYTTLTVQSQQNVQGAQPCFIEGSAVVFTASFFDTDGNPWAPGNVWWQLTDVTSGDVLQNWTGVPIVVSDIRVAGQPPPNTTVTVQIPSMTNQMVSLTRPSETHQVLLRITDGIAGLFYYARALFDLLAVSGL